jgi:Tol biopolymer transport system component
MKPILVATIIFAVAMAAPADEKKANELIQAAQAKETVQGDLKAAIALYGQAVHEAGPNRALVAKSLLRMAECYQKMGNEEARKVYEQIVREYADQKEVVTEARAHLGGGTQTRRQTNTLVSSSKIGAQASISPDGRLISFVDPDTGDLALRDVATGADRRLTNKGTWAQSKDEAEFPVISRDGKQVVFTWWREADDRYDLRLANTSGDPNPRRLYGNPGVSISPDDWSPDGKFVAVEVYHKDKTGQIGLISVGDGSLRVLKSTDWRAPGRIHFSPDGKYLAYDLPPDDTGSARDIFVLSADGAREIHAVAHPANDRVFGWSPDGKWLLFTSDRTGSPALWGLPFEEDKPAGAPELLKANLPAYTRSIGITRSGALYYGGDSEINHFKIHIAVFDFATGKLLSDPTVVTPDYLDSNVLPDWSPDGRLLAYTSVREPSQRNVLVIRSMDSGEVRELHPKLNAFSTTFWSPDSRWLLTRAGDLKGRWGISQIDAQTGDVTPLLLDQPGEQSWYPGWTADGKSILYKRDYRATKDSAIIRREIATGKETELIRGRSLGQADKPRISPDGKYLVTNSIDEAANVRTLLLVPVAGGDARELMRVPSEIPAAELADRKKGAWITLACWTPDSRAVLALKFRGDPTNPRNESLEMWRIPIDGGAPRKLEGALQMSDNLPFAALHPDGRRIAFTVTEPAPHRDKEIWALENFLPSKTKSAGK